MKYRDDIRGRGLLEKAAERRFELARKRERPAQLPFLNREGLAAPAEDSAESEQEPEGSA